LRLLIVHNFYLFPGGEDQVFYNEMTLLREYGHDVYEYTVSNEEISKMSLVAAGINTIWSRRSFTKIKKLLTELKPDLVHFHNIFPILSPSVYFACNIAKIPVVQTLHNYRLLCPSALFFRQGKTCLKCLDLGFPWPAIRHACYRNSYGASIAVVAMLLVHRWLSSWKKQVDCYIALSEFSRQKFIQGGVPKKKIMVKPNFTEIDPDVKIAENEYALFIGRISAEKGIDVLLRAWQKCGSRQLLIFGKGPLEAEVQEAIRNCALTAITMKGQTSRREVITAINQSQFVIVPSLCFENFPLVIIEAFACGVPVIASRLGAIAEIVQDQKTGLLFTAGDAEDLSVKLLWAWDHPIEMSVMGRAARSEYEAKYTSERNYQLLMDIYQYSINSHRSNYQTDY